LTGPEDGACKGKDQQLGDGGLGQASCQRLPEVVNAAVLPAPEAKLVRLIRRVSPLAWCGKGSRRDSSPPTGPDPPLSASRRREEHVAATRPWSEMIREHRLPLKTSEPRRTANGVVHRKARVGPGARGRSRERGRNTRSPWPALLEKALLHYPARPMSVIRAAISAVPFKRGQAPATRLLDHSALLLLDASAAQSGRVELAGGPSLPQPRISAIVQTSQHPASCPLRGFGRDGAWSSIEEAIGAPIAGEVDADRMLGSVLANRAEASLNPTSACPNLHHVTVLAAQGNVC
jgi:hypothetical protein